MTNQQLYLAVGIPFFTVILVWLGTTLSNRAGLAAIRASIDDLRGEMRAGFADIHRRIDDTNKRIDDTNKRIDDTNGRIGRLEARLDTIDNELRIGHERRIATLEAHVLGRAS